MSNQNNKTLNKKQLLGLTLGSIGVVFGDIGTSPLYALKESFSKSHGIPFSIDATLGILSLLFWSMILVVTLKYIYFVLRADNNGEGGILALMALALRNIKDGNNGNIVNDSAKNYRWIFLFGIFGACMFYGDAIITPAISVLSAIEGLEIATPALEHYVLPLTFFVLIILFSIQRYGTHIMGKLFGPIMLLWFVVLAILGIMQIVQHPNIIFAINPIYAVNLFINHSTQGFIVLGSVFLVLTGAEALYADMGHFGIRPIRYGWIYLVMPALVLNYFGQGALLISHPEFASNPFYFMVPSNLQIPIIILATLATSIASQAVISGAFSLTSQAMQLGYLPKMTMKYTSSTERGQIYIPAINWSILLMVLLLVSTFKTSEDLAAMYGIAVTTTMIITTLLASVVMQKVWKWRPIYVKIITCMFISVDLSFFAANALKITDGGWLPLLAGIVISFIMLTWYKGKQLLRDRGIQQGLNLQEFINILMQSPPVRVDGIAVFLCSDPSCVPAALLHNLKHNRILHKKTFFVHLETLDIPKVLPEKRFEMQNLGDGLYIIHAVYGFMETPSLMDLLKQSEQEVGIVFDIMDTSFFLARESVIPSNIPGMSIAREHLFAWMHRNAAKPSDFFNIPANRIVELGTKVEI
jgi:KUP system potassium uptake protein